MIEVDGVSHVYAASRDGVARHALDRVSLRIPAGRFCVLTGPNGSGKSTLFRLLCGLARPSAGSVRIAGHDPITQAAAARSALGVVFQSPAVDKQLSVRENLEIHGRLHGIDRKTLTERAAQALEWTGIAGRLNDKVETLSGGMARQVELVKVLVTRPRVVLLDEPTTGLDPLVRRSFLLALRRAQREQGLTVLMTSHIFAEAEDADEVAILKDGRLLAHDAPEALTSRLGGELVVIRAPDPERLARELPSLLGGPLHRAGAELRFEAGGASRAAAAVEAVMTRHGGEIDSIAIKRPELEDVFIALATGAGAEIAAPPRPLAEEVAR